jgi:hypothetical protein
LQFVNRGSGQPVRPDQIPSCHGATNQAVTNITEAFVETAHTENDYVLAQRWNPFVNSYGIFFASDRFAKENAGKMRNYQDFQKSVNIKERCLFSLREARNPFSPNELPELRAHYLRKAAETAELRGTELDQIVTELRSLLRRLRSIFRRMFAASWVP